MACRLIRFHEPAVAYASRTYNTATLTDNAVSASSSRLDQNQCSELGRVSSYPQGALSFCCNGPCPAFHARAAPPSRTRRDCLSGDEEPTSVILGSRLVLTLGEWRPQDGG